MNYFDIEELSLYLIKSSEIVQTDLFGFNVFEKS